MVTFAILRKFLKTALFKDKNKSMIAKNEDRRPSLVEDKFGVFSC